MLNLRTVNKSYRKNIFKSVKGNEYKNENGWKISSFTFHYKTIDNSLYPTLTIPPLGIFAYKKNIYISHDNILRIGSSLMKIKVKPLAYEGGRCDFCNVSMYTEHRTNPWHPWLSCDIQFYACTHEFRDLGACNIHYCGTCFYSLRPEYKADHHFVPMQKCDQCPKYASHIYDNGQPVCIECSQNAYRNPVPKTYYASYEKKLESAILNWIPFMNINGKFWLLNCNESDRFYSYIYEYNIKTGYGHLVSKLNKFIEEFPKMMHRFYFI